MVSESGFDPLERFAEIERLAAKVYFRFSHLFIHNVDLRDFWWHMGVDEEQHSSILLACKEIIKNLPNEGLDPSINRRNADRLKELLSAYLSKGTPSITVEEAFNVALEIETSEINVIYDKLVALGGPEATKMMENLGEPANVQKQKLKRALLRFTNDPKLHAAAMSL
jgi:hypothetical protein